ncbi:MAG: hypothetical protein ABL958_01425 [Bdellovibrionia bacterium]
MNALIRSTLLVVATFSSVAWGQLPEKVPVCTDRYGQKVPVIVDVRVPTYAAAFFHPEYRRAMIVINPKIADRFTPKFNAWVYLHECGHVVLGHVEPRWTLSARIEGIELFGKLPDRQAQLKELEADCWGAKQSAKHGYWRSEADVSEVIKQMVDWKEDPEHPSGVVRAKGLIACLQRI